jgi:hypothetical protein
MLMGEGLILGRPVWVTALKCKSRRKPQKKLRSGAKHLFADGACDRTAPVDDTTTLKVVVEVVRHHDQQPGVAFIARRRGVEFPCG